MSTAPALRLVERSSACFSSARGDWGTPPELFAELDAEFHFALDAAASRENALCERFLTVEDDALISRWTPGPVWLNPPYGRGVGRWVRHALEESRLGETVVCLLPARTDTAWFQWYVWPHAEVRFLPGRLRFVGAENSAPFPSLVAIFHAESVQKRALRCESCGRAFVRSPRRRGSTRRFCDSRCRRTAYRREHGR